MTTSPDCVGGASTVVLRLRATARNWRSAARVHPAAPLPVRALLAGRTRVEVSADEAVEVLAWARSVPGWRDGDVDALDVYPLGSAG